MVPLGKAATCAPLIAQHNNLIYDHFKRYSEFNVLAFLHVTLLNSFRLSFSSSISMYGTPKPFYHEMSKS